MPSGSLIVALAVSNSRIGIFSVAFAAEFAREVLGDAITPKYANDGTINVVATNMI